jgi:lysyl-tRNA synthetase class 2
LTIDLTRETQQIVIMADEKPPAAADASTSDNLHTDPVTGEKISKSELKRREKQREREKKKAEKEAALPARPKAEGKKADVEELNPNVRSRQESR